MSFSLLQSSRWTRTAAAPSPRCLAQFRDSHRPAARVIDIAPDSSILLAVEAPSKGPARLEGIAVDQGLILLTGLQVSLHAPRQDTAKA